ncbi:hypothetical protein [Streptomyces lancefieldiae]|uniref:Uncharacterized protein n=1 Tax=Streptomyces lancefieldiae TaxID=3075520 RepID=A0ABU3AFC8_9ACTN|nr:hypothetical protein [Streptomyces sp. DSM 40712]MDT0608886.1 hypothetical protein [Streptomyces sp. DSM 40712]
MPAISVGSVEVDVLPNARGITRQMQRAVLPAANEVGEEVGRVMGRYISAGIADAVRSGVTTGGRQAQAPAARQGQSTGSTFARSFRAQLQAGLAALPEVRLRADSSDAQRELADIRTRMMALQDLRIGIDLDSATASAAMTQLQARLDRLSASDADVQIRVDAAAASSQLAAFNAQVSRLDGRTANVDVDTRSAAANFNLLTTAALTLGPAILPVLPVVAAGLGAVAAAGVAAAAGVGGIALVAVPAFKQISTVLQAQKAAQDAAAQSTANAGQAAAQAASRSMQLASASAAVASAERNGARQVARAQEQVSQARRQAAQVAAQASQRAQQAARAVEDAEESLADAQRDARRAQEDLTAARKEAAQELLDLQTQLTNSRLSERDAEIALAEATAERDAVLKSAASTELDKQKALLAYDQAVQRLKEQRAETRQLEADTASANKAGVEGSDTVRQAQEQLADAQDTVADRTQALRDAQADQARTAQENAQQLADAQQRIADAQQGVADAQVQAAEQVASAQRSLAQAQQSGAATVDQAALAQQKYRDELAKLSPAARATMTAFTSLKSAFSAWSESLQPAVMPIFTRALDGLRRLLPGLTPVVLEAAAAIQSLMDKASAELKTPFWQGFKDDLQGSVRPAIEGLGVAFGNVFKGMAGIIGAFLPHMDSISQRMQDVTGRFADWAGSLKGSPDFQRFLQYSSDMAPRLGEALRQVAGAAISISAAMSPISAMVLDTVAKVADGVGWLADKAPWLVQTIYGIVLAMTAWRIAMILWRGTMVLASAAMAAFNLISMAGPWGWIALAVAGVVAVIVLLYTKCEWFRDSVQAVWQAIQLGAQVVVDWFRGPFARFWTQTLPQFFSDGWDLIKKWVLYPVRDFFTVLIPGWAQSLRDMVVSRWNALSSGLSTVWTGIKQYVLYPIRDFFTKTIPGWGTTLKDRMVGAFEAARDGIRTAWEALKKIGREPIQYIVDIVYNKGIVGVWNKVATAFGADKLEKFTFARGGVMPGYTPGRDVHRFVSPTGGALELSGGEAIMRPEFTRAVGSGFVHSMNSIARSQGAGGVKAALAPVFGGNPSMPTDTTLRYADGGIFGWIGSAANKVAGAGSAVWNEVKEGASWLKDGLEGSARAGVEHVVDPLLASFPGMDTMWGKAVRRIPTKIVDTLFGYSKESDKKGGGGIGGPKVQAALKWAKTQDGLPYQWGGGGNPSWDCSGFMSAIESVLRGQKPHRRWATMAFQGKTAPPGWVYHGNSPFKIGITNAGVGHTAGTLGKTNVESRGGDGVVVGSRARGYRDPLFTDWYGFMPGKFDNGGMLQPGFNLAYNGTGRPEPVLTGSQFNALARGDADSPITVEINTLDRALAEFIDVRVHRNNQELISVINAS